MIQIINNSTGFAVNGSALPEVTFDVGESYAGSLPISNNTNDTNTLFFWFFPSENQTVGKEITIWLTGGVKYTSRYAFMRVPLLTREIAWMFFGWGADEREWTISLAAGCIPPY